MDKAQATSNSTNVPSHPNELSATYPITTFARIAVPKKYPKNPVNPADVPAAFLGARSSYCTPISITGP